MFNLGDRLKSIAAIAAFFGVGTAPNITLDTAQYQEANSPVVQEWFESEMGKVTLAKQETTLPISKKPWKELGEAEKQIILTEFKERDREHMTTFLNRA